MKLSWLILSAAIELGGFCNGTVYDFDNMQGSPPSPPLYTTLSVDAQAGPFFVTGLTETVYFLDEFGGRPFDATYSVGAGLRFGNIELGWSHFCVHPVEICGGPVFYQRFAGEADRVYLRASIGPKASGNGP